MFGSVSNWINNKLPQNIPTVSMPSMPAMPAMPTMPHMPAMPHMPDLFGKNKSNEENIAATTPDGSNQTGETTTVGEEQPQISQPEATSEPKQDLNNIEPVEDEAKQANGEVAEGEEGEKGDQKFSINIGIDPTKALGNVKDIGNNIGSKTHKINNYLFKIRN